MATSAPRSISPVQEPFVFPDDGDDWLAQFTGDEFPNLFVDLPDGTDLNVSEVPSTLFDDFPNRADQHVDVRPSNLFDDYLDGAGEKLSGDPLSLLDDSASGVIVDGRSVPSNPVYGSLTWLDLNIHEDPDFSPSYQGALPYDTGTLSLPIATDPGFLPRTRGVDEDISQLSDIETIDPTILQNQLARFTNFEAQQSCGTEMDGILLSSFVYGTTNSQERDVCHDMAMPETWGNVIDSSAAANCSTFATSNTIFGPLHSDSTDDYRTQSASLAETTFPATPFGLDTGIFTQDSMVGNAMRTTSTLDNTQTTQSFALRDGSLVNDENEQDQPHLGWISYDQSSFANETITPRPVHTCNLPDNRKRGRREPLADSKRKKIAEMRKLKSCLLCRMKKKDVNRAPVGITRVRYTDQRQCDNGTPCKRCLDAARSRPSLLPCLRAPLADLTAAFIPHEYIHRHGCTIPPSFVSTPFP